MDGSAPVTQGRNVYVPRSSPGQKPSSPGFRDGYRRSTTYTLNPGKSSAMASTGVNNILQGRSKEKKDMQELNQRFGSYIENVRFLEAQNRKLAAELNTLRERWGQETEKIKNMYEREMKQLKKLLDESERNKAELQVRVTTMEDRLSELQISLNDAKEQEKVDKDTIDRLNQQITDYESETNIMKKRISRFDDERARDRKENERLRNEVTRLRQDLDAVTLAHITASNNCQSANEELEFQKQVHESQLKELASLAYRDTTAENRDYWKAELSQAIHDIQSEYDNKMEIMKHEMESMYTVKISEMRNTSSRGSAEFNTLKEENIRIKNQLTNLKNKIPELENKNTALENQIRDLQRQLEELRRDHEIEEEALRNDLTDTRAELSEVLEELQTLLDAKLSLELEIVAYRKLLEAEESRSTEKRKYDSRMDLILPPKTKPKSTEEQIQKVNGSGVEAAITAKTESTVKSEVKTVRTEVSSGEMSARTSFQRTAKGNVSIKECSGDGTHIVLENTGSKKKQDISGWTLKRDIDAGRQTITFKFPANTVLDSEGQRKQICVWAKGLKPKGSTDLECNETNWGIGSHQVLTALTNEKGEERATHTARTTYSH